MIKIIRVAQGKNSTLSHLYIHGLFACYLLEDSIRKEKIPGLTCIPEGEYGLSLNHGAGMNARYGVKYPHMHAGMIEITEIPNYRLVFIHIGNYHTQTAGCPLTGSYWQRLDGDYQVMHSAAAYHYVYPLLLDQIERGNDRVVVKNGFYACCTPAGPPSLR
ncbi:DUF5675 family protein [Parapedobacter indicus]|uniref:DUF5675 domain-containing protein n=1 Tax=Parapedobacter indicus TaxID=1477437 RepID=A0A1I3TGF2_9SPHI|nr:DUF5675 family protein [Parapedobacter indicus]PPK99496.1 hypothetical protein CLV26_11214 [Parapedobacter indicus]SFJ69985.1 hypothetical protein SAMN05444682_112167 [Parapedobacter indicus]